MKTKKLTELPLRVVIITILSLMSCQQKHDQQEIKIPPKWVAVDTSNKNSAIAVLPTPDGQKVELTDKEMVLIDSLVKQSVNGYNHEMRSFFEESKLNDPKMSAQLSDYTIDLDNYKRQYMVTFNQMGEKLVHINCLCFDFGNDEWKTREIIVQDGGNCFFHLDVNIFKEIYIDFVVNGSA